MVHVVLVVLLARRDQPHRRRRLVGRQPAPLVRRVGTDADEDDGPAAGPPREDPEHFVLLFMEQDVGRGIGAERVTVQPIGPLGHVGDRVEERLVVRGPGRGRDPRDLLGEELAGDEVLDVEGVVAEARVVRGVGEQVAVVADLSRSHRHELLALRERVDVEVNLLGGVEAALLAAVDRVLLPLLRPRVVVPAAVAVRDRQVRLLDAPEHLVVQVLLERLGRLHEGFGVGVLGFEKRADLRVLLLAHPEVVVVQGLAVQRLHVRHLLRNGRGRVAGEREARRETGREDREECGSAAVHGVTAWAPRRRPWRSPPP